MKLYRMEENAYAMEAVVRNESICPFSSGKSIM